MYDRMIVEKTSSELTRALHQRFTDLIEGRHSKGMQGVSIQRLSTKIDEDTGSPIFLHEKRLLRPHDKGFRPKRVVYPVFPEGVHFGVVDRRAQESLFPVDKKVDLFGPLSDIPADHSLLAMDRKTADIITSIESTDVLKRDFESIEGTEANQDDRERANEVIAIRGEITDLRQQLMQKRNRIVSYHNDLYGLAPDEFRRRLVSPGPDEGQVESYLVREYLEILELIDERSERINALSGAVFSDAQDRLNLDVSDLPMFDFRNGTGWNFGD